jgi:hypothetical protein
MIGRRVAIRSMNCQLQPLLVDFAFLTRQVYKCGATPPRACVYQMHGFLRVEYGNRFTCHRSVAWPLSAVCRYCFFQSFKFFSVFYIFLCAPPSRCAPLPHTAPWTSTTAAPHTSTSSPAPHTSTTSNPPVARVSHRSVCSRHCLHHQSCLASVCHCLPPCPAARPSRSGTCTCHNRCGRGRMPTRSQEAKMVCMAFLMNIKMRVLVGLLSVCFVSLVNHAPSAAFSSRVISALGPCLGAHLHHLPAAARRFFAHWSRRQDLLQTVRAASPFMSCAAR